MTVESRPDASESAIEYRSVSAAYFQMLGIRVVTGRAFDGADVGGRPVAIINESTARRYWPGEDPIGRRIVVGEWRGEAVLPVHDPPGEIVGVVADHRDVGLEEPVRRTLFVP